MRTLLTLTTFLLVMTAPAFAQFPDPDEPDSLVDESDAVVDAPPPDPAESKVVEVTVYPGTALVTREVQVPAGEGVAELIVTPLPARVVGASLYSEGSEGAKILSTRFRTRVMMEDVRADVRAADAEVNRLEAVSDAADAAVEVAKQDLEFVGKLEGFTATTLEGTVAKGAFEDKPIVNLAEYVMKARAEASARLVERQHNAEELSRAVELAEIRRDELADGSGRTASDAVILVERTGGEAATVRLNYLVEDASWEPRYRFRVGVDSEPVRLEYLGSIVQTSGESWDDVRLTLSTAQPSLEAIPPDLDPLRFNAPTSGMMGGMGGGGMGGGGMGGGGMGGGGMGGMGGELSVVESNVGGRGGMMPSEINQMNKNQAEALRGRAREQLNTDAQQAGKALLNQAAAFDQANELIAEEPAAGQGDQDANRAVAVTFQLDRPLSIPSRRDPLIVEVARAELDPEFFDRAVPVLSPRVYRMAHLKNDGQYVLLPGEAAMYVGNDFVGRMELPLVAAGEQFTVGFGSDPQVQVDRRLREKSEGFQGGNQVHNYKFRIAVRSFRDAPVKVEVWDRLPLFEGESVAVSLVTSEPSISDEDNYVRNVRPENLLRWDLEVAPESEPSTIVYEFKLEYARGLSLDQISAGIRVEPIRGGAEGAGFGGGFRSVGQPASNR